MLRATTIATAAALLFACAAALPVGGLPGARPWTTEAELESLKAEMANMARALGVRCDHCHDIEAGFEVETLNKQITRIMIRRLTAPFEEAGGGARVTCASCHAGSARLLGDRFDDAVVKKVMKGYTTRFHRAGGGKVGCDTCHVGPDGKPARRFLPTGIGRAGDPEEKGKDPSGDDE